MMMDFDAQDGNEFEDANLIQASGNAAPPAAARAGGAEIILTPNAQGVVVLPDGISLEDVQVEGRNLVVIADDGTRYVIIDGAIFVPQLVIDGVVVPPVNLAALLVGNEPQPAAGPQGPGGNAQSSGGNFAGTVGDLQAAFDLGNLLPYTELQFPQDEEREIIPDIVDRDPDISIEIDDSGVSVINAQDAVNEAGLPARNGEPAGSNSAASSESTYGFINFSSPDGTSEVTLNGVVITQVGQAFTTPLGVLTITSIADGRIGYGYVLTDNTTNPASMDNFAVTITDSDGDMATATLRIDIVDDVPTARNDTDSVPASTFTGQTGNVVTGAGTTSGGAGADTPGADGAAVTGIHAGTTGTFAAPGTVNGQYGTLSIDAQGNYTYTRSANTPGGVNDVFTYRLTDGDGDTSTATLTISIGDAPVMIVSVPTTGAGTVVDEEGLPARPSETPGSNEPANVETTAGTITFTTGDGLASVTINGTAVTGPGQQIVLPQGTLTIVSFDPGGSIGYSFTLADNTSGDSTQVNLSVTVTDLDGDTDTEPFTITIVDDTPTARPDADSVTEDGPTVADGNVISGSGGTDANATDGVADTQGADGASVTAVAFGATAGTVGTALSGAYGSLTLNADGSYSYTLNNAHPLVQGLDGNDTLTEVFSYTLTDGDGDASTTTLTITINGADDVVVINGLDGAGAEETVYEDDLTDGSSPDAAALTQSGTFTVDSPDGLATLTVNGTAVFGAGVTYPVTFSTAYGTMSVTGVATTTDASGDVTAATVSYSYTLTDNTAHTGANAISLTESFAVAVTDTDGSTDTASLDVTIIDDVPTAAPDADSVTEDGPAVADGNVTTGSGGADANATDGATDTQGADGASVTAVAFGATAGSVGAPLAGAYGSLTLNADGSYTYALDSALVQGLDGNDTLTEIFDYTLADGDGDASTTTLTITINGADDVVVINGLDGAGAEETVYEDDLTDGSSPDAAALTQGGTFTVDSPDGLATLTVNGTAVFGAGVVYPVTFSTAYGTMSITGVATTTDGNGDVTSATVSYSYTLNDNTLLHTGGNDGSLTESFSVAAIDTDGSSDTASLDVIVVDDVPTAAPDADSVTEDGPTVADGSVITGSGGADANATDGATDTQGADGASVTAVTFGATNGTVGAPLAGAYGSLTLNADGSYSYTLNNAHPLVQGLDGNDTLTEIFDYTLVDGDGDTSATTLTITINGADDVVVINGLDGAGAEELVDEDDLADGSSPDAAALTQGGTFTVDSPDGLATLTVNGTAVFGAGVVYPVTFSTAHGTMSITGVATTTDGNGDVTSATVSYSYTLDDNTLLHTGGNDGSLTESFSVAAIDTDGSSDTASLDVTIVDDVPTAFANTNSVAEGAVVAGNVLTDDTDDVLGADGAAPGGAVTGVAAGSDTSNPVAGGVGGVIIGTYGTLTLNANGSYSYDGTPNTVPPAGATDIFVYTITDGDGDTSTTTLTITLTDASFPVGDTDALVNEAGLPSGSNAASNSEVFNGAITPAGGTGPYTYTLTSPAAGAYGNLVLNAATGTYTYTLTQRYDTSPDADNSTNTEQDRDSFSYTVTDANGNTATGTILVDIVDDVPTAFANTNSVAEGAVVAGNVLTDDTDDVFGADGPAGAGVTGVAAGTNTASPVSGGLGAPIVGAYGTLTLNANGTYSYDANPNVVVVGSVVDHFVYTITDGDGDTSTTTLDITINNVTVTAADTDALVNEAGLPAGSDAASSSEVFNGAITPAGGTGPYTYTLTSAAAGSFGSLVLNANGTYTYTLTQRYDTSPDADNSTNTEQDRDSFSYTVTDANGNTATGTILVDIVDDVPTAFANTNSVAEGAVVGGNVLTDDTDDVFGADGPAGAGVTGVAAGTNTASPVSGGLGGAGIAGTYGTLILNADGSYSYDANPNVVVVGSVVDHFVYTITDGDGDTSTTTLDITINNVTVTAADTDALVNEKGLAAGGSGENADGIPGNSSDQSEVFNGAITPAGGTGPYTYTLTSAAAGSFGNLVLNANGTYTYTLTQRYDTSPDADNSTNTEQDRDSFSYTVTDANGNTATGTILVDIVDDVPTAITPKTTSMNNAIGATGGNYLDDDNDVDNDYGADGGKVIFTAASITSLQGQNLTSGFASLNYAISPDGTVLTATKSTDGTTVFTISLQPIGSPDQYVVNISQKLDSTTTIDFNAGNYNFEGGNSSWAGFVVVPEDLEGNPPTTIDNNSPDLLLTPEVNGAHSSTLKTTANIGGVGNGASVGTTETFRVDFVTDLRGDPADGPGEYNIAANRDHVFDGHYTVNGVSALFKSTTNSTVTIAAYDDPDGNNVVGDGVQDTINGVVITWRGGAPSALITTGGVYNVNGHNFTVTFNGNGSVTVAGVEGDTGSSMVGTVIAVYTASGYNSVEYTHAGGQTFQIGDFGATVQTTDPIDFTVPTTIIDNDGDTASGGTLAITLNATTPPVALDLDGDGVEFVSSTAGIAFDYDGNGVAESTAWVAGDDGILAIDLNANGAIDSGAELVFGTSALTDLAGLAASYDSNGDGTLDAQDAAFAQFGVLQNGKFVSLSEAGIVSIGLASDGVGYTAANGDVIVSGTGTYTRADGSTGTFADAAFATSSIDRRTAEVTVATAAAGALVVPELLAANDTGTTADEPQIGDAFAPISTEVEAAPSNSADQTVPDKLSYLVDDSAPVDEGAEQSSSQSEEPATADFSTAPEAANDTADAGSGSEAVANFSSSSGGLFQFDGGEAMMEALLVNVSADAGALQTQDLAPVHEILAEGADEAAVDAIVSHFADGADAANPPTSELTSSVLLEALDTQLFFAGNGAPAPDVVDEAAQLAATAQA